MRTERRADEAHEFFRTERVGLARQAPEASPL
jgi:hypothetical protein